VVQSSDSENASFVRRRVFERILIDKVVDKRLSRMKKKTFFRYQKRILRNVTSAAAAAAAAAVAVASVKDKTRRFDSNSSSINSSSNSVNRNLSKMQETWETKSVVLTTKKKHKEQQQQQQHPHHHE